jgi:hypothetical protein
MFIVYNNLFLEKFLSSLALNINILKVFITLIIFQSLIHVKHIKLLDNWLRGF